MQLIIAAISFAISKRDWRDQSACSVTSLGRPPPAAASPVLARSAKVIQYPF